MAKIRVYELARELKMESKALLAKLKELDIQVPSHQSTLTAAQIEKIRVGLTAVKPKVVVRRRKKSADSDAGAGESIAMSSDSSESESESESDSDAEVVEESGAVAHNQSDSSTGDVDAVSELAAITAESVVSATVPPESREAIAVSLEGHSESPDLSVETVAVGVEPSVESDKSSNAEALLGADSESDLPDKIDIEVGENRGPLKPVVSDGSNIVVSGGENSEAEKLDTSTSDDTQLMARKVDLSVSAAAEPKPKDKKISQESSSDEVQSAPKRKSFSGATIVRKATSAETEAILATEEARQRTSRREDSRGVRVTGIGVSPRMGANEDRPGSAVANKAVKPKAPAGAAQGAVDDSESATSGPKWATKEKAREKVPTKKEEEERLSKAAPAVKKRVSMRDLLDETKALDGEAFAPARKRRTVYTPSAQQKKKDAKRRKDLKSTNITTPRAAYRVVKVEGAQIVVSELAMQLSIKANELIKKLMGQGVMATVNQNVDFDTAALVAGEYGFECKNVEKTVEDVLGSSGACAVFENRAPIITVMGHVDHGKTSILDAIRKSEVASGESGGITQHIGAYTVERGDARFTFLDTPGHAAFSAMRARGAEVTDIVVLVVAADDGVMPQTVEAISHAKSAGVPIIVAVNKIDKPNLNLDKLYNELSEQGVQTEEWGGDSQFVKVSALKGEGLDELLEAIQIQSEILELSAPVDCKAEGVIVEAHLDTGRGPVSTVLVTRGVLKTGDFLVAGKITGKVRAMRDFMGNPVESALPSMPVEVVGLTAVPMAGDQVNAVLDERLGREVADLRQAQEDRENEGNSAASTLEELLGRVNSADTPKVNFIIKGDTQGSVEAIASSMTKLNTDQVRNLIVHKAVGGINESDLNLADTSHSVILAFNVRASGSCGDLAEQRGIVVKYFSVIYDLVDAVKSVMSGVLPPIETEVVQGHAEVRNAISVPKIGTVAGSSVTDGKITRGSYLRLIRDEIVVYSGKIGSLRRFKDDVKEVQNGYECGISIDGFTDIKVGDVIEAFKVEESAATIDFNEI